MYVLEDDGVKAECLVTDEGDGILEIKSLPRCRSSNTAATPKRLLIL